MKQIIWALKIISSAILIFALKEDTFIGSDILWSDIQVIVLIDTVVLMVLLYLYVVPAKRKTQSNLKTIYMLIYGNTIKGFGFSFCDLTYQLNEARRAAITSKQQIKVIKLLITDTLIKSEEVFVE